MTPRADRFPLFDGLRAIAALSVVAFHAAFFARAGEGESLLMRFASHLDVGVTIFFLISGFLLYRPFVRARMEEESMPRVGAYAWRRLLRIAPAYWVALTVIAIWLGRDYVFTAWGVPTFYGFLQIYDFKNALRGIDQAWTLCIEVTFYAFLPIWALLMRALPGRGDPRRILVWEIGALVVLAALSFAWKIWALRQVSPNALDASDYLMPLPNFLDQFALGMGLAVLSVWSETRARLPAPAEFLRRRPWIPWIGALAAYVAVCTAIGFTGASIDLATNRMFLGEHLLFAAVAFFVVAPAVFAEPGSGLVARVLGNRVMLYVGLVSYAVYLYHLAVIKQLDDWFGDSFADMSLLPRTAIYFVLGAAGATLLASLSYYVVERPALRLKRFVSPGSEAARGEAIMEPAPASPPSPRG